MARAVIQRSKAIPTCEYVHHPACTSVPTLRPTTVCVVFYSDTSVHPVYNNCHGASVGETERRVESLRLPSNTGPRRPVIYTTRACGAAISAVSNEYRFVPTRICPRRFQSGTAAHPNRVAGTDRQTAYTNAHDIRTSDHSVQISTAGSTSLCLPLRTCKAKDTISSTAPSMVETCVQHIPVLHQLLHITNPQHTRAW